VNKLNELAERVEAATGPDRELDRAISDALGVGRFHAAGSSAWQYTSSLDTAMTLVPEGWLLQFLQEIDYLDGEDAGPPWTAELRWRENFSSSGRSACQVWCATPALALCAAALRARSQESDQ